MHASEFDEPRFFAAIAESGARALLIGRRAMVALGAPVLTRDYDYWVHGDDLATFNAAVHPFGLVPNASPEEAHRVGRYTLENDEHVDVLVAKIVHTIDGVPVAFDDLWSRRIEVEVGPGIHAAIPAIVDLIATKRFAARARDLVDIQQLEALAMEAGE